MKPIAIFFHCVLFIGEPPVLLPAAPPIIAEQMQQLRNSGLLNACSEMHIGVNGGEESHEFSKFFPPKATVTYHGLKSRNENSTILMLEEWVKTHPDWLVFYAHSKGATKTPNSRESRIADPWRQSMMRDLVLNWRQCVADLEAGWDIACSHWMWCQVDGTQHISPGNLWWARSDFLATLPSIMQRERIKTSGLHALESRYEAEVWLGNGPRPNVKAYRSIQDTPGSVLPYHYSV